MLLLGGLVKRGGESSSGIKLHGKSFLGVGFGVSEGDPLDSSPLRRQRGAAILCR